MYLAGQPVERICPQIGISRWQGFQLKRKLGLHVERWQRVGMPATFSPKTLEVLYGTLLGDASLQYAGGNKYANFTVSHSPKARAFIEAKKRALGELKPSKVFPAGDRWGTLTFFTSPHPEFDQIRQQLYPAGRKSITQEYFAKLTERSLAWWFMDDGGCTSHGVSIATCSFSVEECELIANIFEDRWGIRPRVANADYPRLYFRQKEATVFSEMLRPYLLESMLYKIQFKRAG
jgi:hypothetical protein